MNVFKVIEAGENAVKKNPQIKLSHEDLNTVLRKNNGNVFQVAIDCYYIGISLGFLIGRRYEQSKNANEHKKGD